MKHLLLTTIAAVVLVGCGESQQSAPAPEAKPAEPVAEAAKPEPKTVKVPYITLERAVMRGNIEAVRSHITADTDLNEIDFMGRTPLDWAYSRFHHEIADLIRKHDGKTADWLKAGESIHKSILAGHIEAMKKHLANGADINAKDRRGKTPLDIALGTTINQSRRRHEKVVKIEMAKLLRANGGRESDWFKAEESIHIAALVGHIEAIKKHLDREVDINAKNDKGQTSLDLAIKENAFETAEFLINKGANFNTEDESGNTPLHHAAGFGHKKIVGLLIAKGTDSNLKNKSGETPLIKAANSGGVFNRPVSIGRLETIELLISKGADIDAQGAGGWSSLNYAASSGRKKIVELLIKKGADVNSKMRLGFTALDNSGSKKDIADYIRKHGGKSGSELPPATLQEAVRRGNLKAVKDFLSKGSDANERDHYLDRTILHNAVVAGHKGIVELLIIRGADVNAKAQDGWTPLHTAGSKERGLKPPYKATPSERKQIVEILIENGADVNAKLPDGTTAIHIATRAGIKDMVDILIAKGANINEKSGELESPLGVAIMQDQEEIADLLRKHGGKTADELGVEEYIYLAAEDGNIEAVKKHLATGADANAKNQRGQASLHYAAVEGYKEIAELLVVKGADVNAKDDDGKTPLDDANEVWEDASPEDKAAKKEIATLLRKHGGKSGAEDSIHTAAWIGNVVAVQQHLVSGVDVNTKNKLGRTPMLYAIQRGHKEIAELLISKGAIQVPRIRINDAVRQSNIEAIKQHLAVGTNFDGRDYAGETPLYLAADFGDKDIVELLINGGANVNAISYKRISESKYTALDSALRSIGTLAGEPSSSHKAIVNLLRMHGGKTYEELKAEQK